MTRILVIEDESSLLEEVLEWLRFEGYDVIGAEDGREGVNRALDSHPDLIFSDVMMPNLDGYHVLIELRTHRETALIPFVFLTAKADRRDMRNGMHLGADDYITKPFTREDLLDAVKSRISKQEMQRRAFLDDVAELRLALTQTLPHELRTPLMSVFGYTELLKMDANSLTPLEIVTIADHIMDGGQRLYRLVENYLLYAQLELSARDSQTTELIRKITTNTPDSLIAQAATTLATQYERFNDLSLQLVAACVCVTETELSKIVMELVDNAFKFSAPGTAVQVSAAQEGDFYEIRISDQGRGMTADEIGRIAAFNQFKRAIYEQQGSGMGLVIAKRLAELFGGSLVIESAPERHHTTVCVRLAMAIEA